MAAALVIQGCGGGTVGRSSEESSVTGSVRLQWDASRSGNVVGYHIYRSNTPGGPYTRVTPATVAETSYTDALVPAGAWYYVATAIDHRARESRPSNEAVAQVP